MNSKQLQMTYILVVVELDTLGFGGCRLRAASERLVRFLASLASAVSLRPGNLERTKPSSCGQISSEVFPDSEARGVLLDE